MESSSQANGTIRFGVFEVDPRGGELRKAGSRIRVQDQPFKVLIVLLERPGEVVTREELQERIWATESFGDFDHAVNVAIAKLRTALGDSAESPRYIETLHRRGYRFVFPVAAPTTSQTKTAVEPEEAQRPYSVRLIAALAALFAVLGSLAVGYRWWGTRQTKSMNVGSWKEKQLTHNTSDNFVGDSAISPDGKYLAFADDLGLHLTVVDTGETHDVALPAAVRSNLRVSWFPDGQRLVLTADSENEGHTIWLSSILGGAPRKLRTHSYAAAVAADSSIAFITGEGHEIWVSGPNGENPRKVLSSKTNLRTVAWSPLSTLLAYTTGKPGPLGGAIGTVSRDGKSQSMVFSSDLLRCDYASPLVWLPDGHLIFERDEPAPLYSVNLWTLWLDPKTGRARGEPEKLTNWFGFVPWFVSASRNGSRFAMTKARDWWDVYVAELPKGDAGIRPKRVSAGENMDWPSDWSPDSKSFLFYSDRNRTHLYQIFRQQLGQDSPELLVTEPTDPIHDAAFSPDGAWVLYWTIDADKSGHLMKVPGSGGTAEKLLEVTMSPMINIACPRNPTSSCVLSRAENGELVFYAVDVDHGLGRVLSRTKIGDTADLNWDVASDGKHLAISSDDQLPGKIRFLDLVNQTQRDLALPQNVSVEALAWAADGKSLFVSISQVKGRKLVEIKPDGSIRDLWDACNNGIESLIAAPNGRYLAFACRVLENNVWLLENSTGPTTN